MAFKAKASRFGVAADRDAIGPPSTSHASIDEDRRLAHLELRDAGSPQHRSAPGWLCHPTRRFSAVTTVTPGTI